MSHAHASTASAPGVERAALDQLTRDLRQIFGDRLTTLIAYGDVDEEGAHTLAFVRQIAFADLTKCAPLTPAWHRLGLATPLILTFDEFRRTLDAFPLEYGAIIARHHVLAGPDPFAGIAVPEADIRRGCERQAKSHLIHLREGFLETAGNPTAVSQLISASAPGFRNLIANLDRLDPGAAARAGISEELVNEVASAASSTIADPAALLARYIASVERLWQYVDGWRG